MIYAGIDGGGTAAKCILISEEGKELARAQAGPANYQVVGLVKAVQEVKTALDLAREKAGVKRIHLLGIGLAGAGRIGDQERLSQELLSQLENVEKFYLTDDGKIAVYAAHGGKPGLVLIAGTGSIVYGLRRDGTTIRAGGWGPLLGDEGSGFWIGLQALQGMIKSLEGREAKSSLDTLLLPELGIKSLDELVNFIYQERLPRREIASLAPLVIREMEQGDGLARGIINLGIKELAWTVKKAGERLGEEKEVPVALVGGLFKSQSYCRLLKAELKQLGFATVRKPVYEAALGGIIYAARQAKLKIPPLM